jgi:hypothetical protein
MHANEGTHIGGGIYSRPEPQPVFPGNITRIEVARDWRWEEDGVPSWCVSSTGEAVCPHVELPTVDQHEIGNDCSEARYQCRLLGRVVWGEYSECGAADWEKAGYTLTKVWIKTKEPEDANHPST